MADKTFFLACPDCGEEIEAKIPEAELLPDCDTGSPITCSSCGSEFEWEYDEDSENLELLEDEDDGEESAEMALGDIDDEGDDE